MVAEAKMATSGTNTIISPPIFDEAKMTWREYKKEIEVWSMLTSLSKQKRGPALWMNLKGKAKEAVKEMDLNEIKAEDGLEKMIRKLDEIFKTDDNQAAYMAYRDFENFVRPQDMNFQDFVIKFEALNSQLKRHNMDLPDGVLAYRFLHSSNLKEGDMKLCRATISEFKYSEMKNRVLSMYGDKVQTSFDAVAVKPEPVFYGENRGSYNPYNHRNNRRGWNRYTRGGTRGGNNFVQPPTKPTNPIGPNGRINLCAICGSKYHYARQCPDGQVDGQVKAQHVGLVEDIIENINLQNPNVENDEISLFQDTADNNSLKWFLGETLGCAVIDSGCSKTVAGKTWLNCFLETLNEDELMNIHRKESNQVFKFGKGEPIKSKGKVFIPVILGKKNVTIELDVVDAHIPLLLSKEALQKAETVLDFKNDVAIMFGEKQNIISTNSGHYAIPLSVAVDEKCVEDQIILVSNVTVTESDPKKIALKLHRQFCHCSSAKLTRLIKLSKLWKEEVEREIVDHLDFISKNCDICKMYKKTPSVPVVSLPVASFFNDVVAMDLITIDGKYILHLIDLFTRYSAASVRSSKRQEGIVDAIMKIWISYFGKPRKFLADNGGEFANKSYTDMCTSLDIELMKTAAESPWSNGTCERHNGILKISILKTMEESGCSIESATAWATSSKNTLSNHDGYSANILVFGRNPSFPSVVSDKLPALTAENLACTVEENLSAMRFARKALIEAESSEKIKRALSHNVRGNTEIKYDSGDKVFFKRNEQKRWHGPAIVIGQDGKQIIVKYGGETVRVHVSRIIHQGMGKELKSSYDNDDDVDKENSLNESSENIVYEEIENLDNMEKGVEGAKEVVESNQDKEKALYPKVKTNIAFQLTYDDENHWRHGEVHSRAGKVGGRHENCFNIKEKVDGKIRWYDFKNEVKEWQPIPSNIMITTSDKESIKVAKEKEVNNWKMNDVFEEVPFTNQHLISTRWVITTKEVESIPITKARLVARGFEDDIGYGRKVDSPTCARESLCLTLSLIAIKGWKCMAMDIKTAFLQGKPIEREIFLLPPKEFNDGNNVWKLKKAVYGLNEASRYWYTRVKDEFIKVGLTMSKFDEALFYKEKDGLCIGIIAVHVDDFIYGGLSEFEKVIIELKSVFIVGSELSFPMRFLGINLDQDDSHIIYNQADYINGMDIDDKLLSGDKGRLLNSEEQRKFRGIVGQLNWIASRTNPLICFDVCQLSVKLSQASVHDFNTARKVKRQAMLPINLRFIKLEGPVFFLAYCDASFANLPDGSSQGGYIIFLSDEENNVSPISWCSKKLPRVCRSTLAAEVMAIIETIDMCCWLRKIFSDIFDGELLKTVIRTDNKSAFDNINSTTPADEKRTRVDIAAIRQSVYNQEIDLQWIRGENQLADCLTKQGSDSFKLKNTLIKGKICKNR